MLKGDRSNLDGEHGDVALHLYLVIILEIQKAKYFGLGKIKRRSSD
jgi:hypothetical protein